MKELDFYDNLLKSGKKKSLSRQQELKKSGLKPTELKGVPLELLLHDDPKKRLQGITELLKSYHPKTMRILGTLQKMELDPTVKDCLSEALKNADIKKPQENDFCLESDTKTAEAGELDAFFTLPETADPEESSKEWQEKILAVEESILRHTEEPEEITAEKAEEKIVEKAEIIAKKPGKKPAKLLLLMLFFPLFVLNVIAAYFFFVAGFLPMMIIFALVSLLMAKEVGCITFAADPR